MSREIPEEKIALMLGYIEMGYSPEQLACKMDASKSTIERWFGRYLYVKDELKERRRRRDEAGFRQIFAKSRNVF